MTFLQVLGLRVPKLKIFVEMSCANLQNYFGFGI